MFSGLNTARKAAWLKSTQLECASDRKDKHSTQEAGKAP